jgi:hypothetical protein
MFPFFSQRKTPPSYVLSLFEIGKDNKKEGKKTPQPTEREVQGRARAQFCSLISLGKERRGKRGEKVRR